MKILVIEDDRQTAQYLANGLAEQGHVVEVANNGRDGLFLAAGEKYDVMVVDRMLPGLDGLGVVKTIRGAGVRTPILFLTTLGGIDDRIEGLEAGGDDYLVKPFAFAELIARLNALARRPPIAVKETTLKVADLEMDLLKRTVRRAGADIELTPLEFKLLEYLMRHGARVVTRTMLLEEVWAFTSTPGRASWKPISAVCAARLTRASIRSSSIPRGVPATSCGPPMQIASSLIFRLTTLYAILFAASVAILFALVWFVTSRSMLAQLAANVQREAISLADEYRATGPAAAAASIERRLQRGGLAYYLLQRRNGVRIAGNIAPVSPVLGPLDLQVRLQSGAEMAADRAQEDLRDAIGYGVLLSDGTFVLAGEDVGRLETVRKAILTAFAVGGGTSAILAILGGLVLSRGFVRRVDSIYRTARQIMAGQLESRVPIRHNGDELDRLAANLNAMLDRIQSLMESLKQVSSDVAHDLRTPLARLRQSLDAARATAQTVEEFPASTDAAIAETEGLLETFSALLRIAQIESGSRKAGFAAVDLSGLFEFVATTFAAVAEDQGHRLVSDIDAGATICGDRELHLQLATNLVENAIRHTRNGTKIELRLKKEVAEIVAVVADNGLGIPPEERAKVFRRFYRLESSRTTPGSGLGLALVAAVAELHGARINVLDYLPGLIVEIRFPASTVSVAEPPNRASAPGR